MFGAGLNTANFLADLTILRRDMSYLPEIHFTRSVYIYAPPAIMKSAMATTCPDCGKRTRMLQFLTPWHGWDSTCLRCGRCWGDGEWLPLPFVRGARQKSIEAAKRRWRSLTFKRLFDARLRDMVSIEESRRQHRKWRAQQCS